MRILSWNINGVQAHMDAVYRLVAEWSPDILCFQNSRKKDAFLAKVPGYIGWLGIIGETLFGGVSAYLHKVLHLISQISIMARLNGWIETSAVAPAW